MSFLGIGKKKGKKGDFQKLPFDKDLPPLPPATEMSRLPDIPSYDSELPDLDVIKKEVTRPSISKPLNIPKRNKSVKPLTTAAPVIAAPEKIEKSLESGHVFVEIDRYKDAVNRIDSIREKLRKADQILDELTRLKQEEDRELNSWRSEIDSIKEKLLEVDKKLFEV